MPSRNWVKLSATAGSFAHELGNLLAAGTGDLGAAARPLRPVDLGAALLDNLGVDCPLEAPDVDGVPIEGQLLLDLLGRIALHPLADAVLAGLAAFGR